MKQSKIGITFSLEEHLGLLSRSLDVRAAVGRETELLGTVGLAKTLPIAHGVDDVHVTMHTGVNTLLPRAIDFAIIAARVGIERLGVSH